MRLNAPLVRCTRACARGSTNNNNNNNNGNTTNTNDNTTNNTNVCNKHNIMLYYMLLHYIK